MARKTSGDGWSFRPADRGTGGSDDAVTESLPPAEQRPIVEIAKRAKGKTVTVIRGLVLTEADVKKLGKSLKNACGTGGTARTGEVELQGDCRDKASAWLAQNGWGKPT